jgi:hypothetical protein
MVTIAWNPLGFHLLEALPNGTIFTAEYYHVQLLTELLSLRPQIDRRRLFIHADNAKPHTTRKCRAFCEEKRLHLAVHPLYSPGLVPSDLLLFGYIKHCPQGIVFPSHKGLLASIHEIVGALPRPSFEDVFRHWMERPEWVSQNNDDFYP